MQTGNTYTQKAQVQLFSFQILTQDSARYGWVSRIENKQEMATRGNYSFLYNRRHKIRQNMRLPTIRLLIGPEFKSQPIQLLIPV